MIEGIKSTWKKRPNAIHEDSILELYHSIKDGDIIAEVPVATRSVDGVHLSVGKKDGRLYCWADLGSSSHSQRQKFVDTIQGHNIELIEVKPKLTRRALGQAIAGRDLFEEQYRVVPFRTLILFPKERGDPAIEWVCKKKRNIDIEPFEYQILGKCTYRTDEAKISDKFEILRRYQDRPKITGDIYTGIRIDDAAIWPGCTPDFVDAIRLLDSRRKGNLFSPITEVAFRKQLQNCEVELIAMPPLLNSDRKKKNKIGALNRSAIGKVLAGKDMFERKYIEQKIKVSRLIILCAEIDWSFQVVWEKEGILPPIKL
jgi:hypothetical protein